MSIKQLTQTERIGPAKVPMDLNVGRLTARDAAQLLALSVGALAVGAVGMLLAWLCLPDYMSDLSGWRVVFMAFGLSVSVLGVGLAVITAWFYWRDWTFYHERLADYHQLYVESHQTTGGVEVERTITGWELMTDRPLHVLGVALAVHERVMKGEASPFSTRQLEGPVWLGGVRLGDLTPATAEETSKLLSDVGLIKGRQARQAGRWSADSEQDVIKAIVGKWARRGGAENE